MKKLSISVCLVLLFATAACADNPQKNSAHSTPCDGINRSLTSERKAILAPVLAKQLDAASVDILQSFKKDQWSILYVDTHDSDESFLFYKGEPAKHQYITTWGGAAGTNEEDDIRNWVLKNVPGIPPVLASCFAWHVTKDRDM